MLRFKIALLLSITSFYLLIFGQSAHAQGSPADKITPKIGLVLEGGGALGFAHVGVLKVLEEERIPVHLIAGTSMGSIVGAAYASGQTVEVMEQTLASTNWDELFNETPPRSELPYTSKPGRNREIFGSGRIGIKDGGFITPSSYIEGQRVLPVLQRLFERAPTAIPFDNLPIPYRAIAVDLESGEVVELDHGDLALAARASMAVPGFFSPVEIDGRLLVDGGVRNNFPVDVAKKMGAEVIIGSYFEYEYQKRDKLEGPLGIMRQMLDFLLSKNALDSIKLLGPNDIKIIPDVKAYSATSFGNATEIMKTGEEAARKVLPQLRHYALSVEDYRRYQASRTRPVSAPQIDFVRVENHSTVPVSRITKRIKTTAGSPLDRATLEEDIARIHALGEFSQVRYEVVTEQGKQGVVVHTQGKDWQEQYVRLGLGLEDNFNGDSSYALGVAARFRNLNSLGAYADLEAEIGKQPRLYGEFMQPLSTEGPFFLAPRGEISRRTIYVRQDGDIAAEYARDLGYGELRTGSQLWSLGEASIGIRRGLGSLDRRVGDQTLPEFDFDVGEVRAEIVIDTLDRVDFPRTGLYARVLHRSSLEEVGASSAYEQLNGRVLVPLTWGPNTLAFKAEFGTTFDELPPEQSYALGGFLDLSGFLQGELTASDYFSGGAAFYHQLSRLGGSLFGLELFGGGSVEFASLRSDIGPIPDNTSIYAGSVFIGTDTTLFPMYLGFGLNSEHEQSIYFVLGRIKSIRQ